MTTTTAEEILHELTGWVCNSEYATCPEIIRALNIGGAIALQLGNIPAYKIRTRMLGFDLNGSKYKFRYRHPFDGVELVEWDGYRDLRVIRKMRSVKDAHGILADL